MSIISIIFKCYRIQEGQTKIKSDFVRLELMIDKWKV